MSFMVPQVEEGAAYEVETTHGTEIVPADLVGEIPTPEDLAPYCEGRIQFYSFAKKKGFLARMSAPGFLDCTEWTLHDSREEAEQYLEATYNSD